MPDSTAGSFAMFGGNEVINSQRTISYINNVGLPISIDADCWCPNLTDLLGDDCPPATGAGPNGEYTFPETDPAPWYDSAIPESGDFLGFLVTEFEGLGSTFTRSTFDILSGGAVLGKLRAQARTLTWRGFLFGRTCCAVEYGMRWLTAELAGGVCDDCVDKELDILLCCPSATGVTPEATCSSQDVTSCTTGEPLGMSPTPHQSAADDAFRTFHKVGLADGPRGLSDRRLGCGSCEETGGGCMKEIEFSLIAGNPYMHRDPVVVCGPTPFPACDGCADDGSDADLTFWQKITTVIYPATEADTAACRSKLECTASPADCNVDPNCPTAELPTIPAFVDPCGCESIFITENCCEISNDVFGQFFEGVPQIEVFSGARPLQNVTIRFYENPQERTCDDEDLFDICNLCDTLTIRYVPANSTLSIDGLTKRISVECPGGNVQPGEPLMATNFRWPVLKCINYIVKISADCCLRAAVSFLKASATVAAGNAFATGTGVLQLKDASQFPTAAGVPAPVGPPFAFTIVTTTNVTVKGTYTGVSGNNLTGVTINPANFTGTIAVGSRITGPNVDPDCSKGVASNATTKITVIPREM